MLYIRLAELCIRIDNQFDYVERLCKDFICEPTDAPDLSVCVTDRDVAEEMKNGKFSEGYCESLCIYRAICEAISERNIFLLHSSVVVADGYAYAFTAKSGVGKSTHTALWLKNVPNARVLNGDKPLYRLEADGSITVFGTPWNGKERWGENASAPLAAICFIERGEVNSIRKADEFEVIGRLMHQLYLRGARETVDRQLVLMDGLVRAVPYYVLSCNISDEAALLAWRTMKQSELGKEIKL